MPKHKPRTRVRVTIVRQSAEQQRQFESALGLLIDAMVRRELTNNEPERVAHQEGAAAVPDEHENV